MSGGREILKLLSGEDVNGGEMDLGVAVLSGLGSGHVDNLAGTALDDYVSILPQGGTLHRVRRRGICIGAVEGDLMLQSAYQ